ncbi:Endonuclease/Exonuclease/phosphatase family protein [Lutibacter oricola]|uniref:Endonuclease/Exonuclease/phosphatase family protein n=1 Tax=Lutibacter oricola TaxID=762486 RepID=A0A1H2RJU7_9FLAO|nr:endonuclease/exonuclease/phosphatase family protein [Lutibacter oricola]SDW19440.1 Endonuclease/Exonuclease/phosphatase family protein [Lutibacter oricola]
MFSFFKSKGKIQNAYTVAFYNLENLFDVEDDPKTLDDDFTPKGKKHWNKKRYKNKLRKLGNVIGQLGTEKSMHSPAIVGVVEVENEKVLIDLVNSKNLVHKNYGYVHYDSPDERGIDVALLYQKDLFELIHSETFPLYLNGKNGERDYTRDVLLVKGKLNGELIHVLVNHWPSRRTGQDSTESKRLKAAELVNSIANNIRNTTDNAKIIIMGDFNDDPHSNSIKEISKNDFYNPMERLLDTGNGSLNHKFKWHLFDQILFTQNFFSNKEGGHFFKYAEVFDKHFLKEWNGKYKGNPFRTYVGKRYLGGFSDHFPVYVYLKKN